MNHFNIFRLFSRLQADARREGMASAIVMFIRRRRSDLESRLWKPNAGARSVTASSAGRRGSSGIEPGALWRPGTANGMKIWMALRYRPVPRIVLILVGFIGFGLASATYAQRVDVEPTAESLSKSPQFEEIGPLPAAQNGPLFPENIPRLLGDEAKRYVADSLAIVRAPLAWGSKDWEKAAAAGLIVGGFMFADEKIDSTAQRRRSPFTNQVSRATSGFGANYGFYTAGGLLISGIVFKDSNVRKMGSDALEAGVLAGLTGSLLKFGVGRQRPRGSEEENVFRPGSGNYSFPSGHATEAFAVASVVAARSQGWVVPSLAYSLATVVALDRVNDRAHFASDVVAGAVLGTVVGRFVVHRHQRVEAGIEPKASIGLMAIPHGLALRVSL